MPRTTFFHSCLGVFQGGGCRAAALVGAYEQAIEHGVQFVEVAGTSAGSIIAVLAGAGASPKQLTEFVAELDFRSFLKPPEIRTAPGFVTRQLARPFGRLADLLLYQGFHSSREIETWVERCLRKLRGDHVGPIPFKMLPLPVSVVATDILSRRPRIWNQKTSPDESVAGAVRASCSIPIFFQPADQRYVDGGVLSNLPAFVFANSAAGRPLTSRILAFVLKGDDEKIAEWGTFPFLSAVANTIVDGAQDLQMQLQSEVHAIVIPTGAIKATDFDKINTSIVSKLIDAGREASRSFFKSELARVKATRTPLAVCYDREDLYNRVTNHLNEDVKDVLIAELSTDFVYQIFPSLLLWQMRGARTHVVIPRTEPKKDGAYRRRLLRKLGVELVEIDSVPFRGYFINGHDPVRSSAYVATDARHVEAVIYEGTIHAAAITTLYDRLINLFSGNVTNTAAAYPKIGLDSQDSLLSRLKTVAQVQPAPGTIVCRVD